MHALAPTYPVRPGLSPRLGAHAWARLAGAGRAFSFRSGQVVVHNSTMGLRLAAINHNTQPGYTRVLMGKTTAHKPNE
jgi:hypothetical protein